MHRDFLADPLLQSGSLQCNTRSPKIIDVIITATTLSDDAQYSTSVLTSTICKGAADRSLWAIIDDVI